MSPQVSVAVAKTMPACPDPESWLRLNGQAMHTCQRLPGKPRITKQTCARRRALAEEIRDRGGNESLFDGGGPVGLDTCLDCPMGEKN